MSSNGAVRVEFITRNAAETKELGRAIGARCRGGEVILLFGQLGAGKTTMVQGIAKGLGVTGPVQSPSFVLERIHRGRLTLRHMDLYRLTPSEVDDAGLLDELDETSVTVIEWADRVNGLLDPDLAVSIELCADEPAKRSILIETQSPVWESYLREMRNC